MAKILMALSGGVDSAVAARLLLDRGHTLEAVFLTHAALDARPAQSAADELGIPLRVVDISDALEQFVAREFERAYTSGRTPNPCVICNPAVKFAALTRAADELGCEFAATGHYCRREPFAAPDALPHRAKLLKSLSANDQSYMLCRLEPEQLGRCVFPLGNLEKGEIRALAERYGLSSAKRPDSMEICFIPDGDYAAWLRARGVKSEPGEFADEDGNVLGTHDGIINYTVGKRRGLRIAAGERLYVKRIEQNTNRIILSDENGMYTDTVRLSAMRGVSRSLDELPESVSVKLRHSRTEHAADIARDGESAVVRLRERVRIPAAGQFAAVYVGEELAASGIIE